VVVTESFEVKERDGAARRGTVRLADPVATPTLVTTVGDAPLTGGGSGDEAVGGRGPHPVLRDAGSLWSAERSVPDPDDAVLTILPHRATPPGTPDAVRTAFGPEPAAYHGPSAAVVSPATAADLGADAYVLGGAAGIVGHGRAFVDSIVSARDGIPADTALYLPGVATPRNVATLAYAGVDLVDPHRAVVRGTQGRYLTTEGDYDLADLAELPCACPACHRPAPDFDREDCAAHNVNALTAELSRVRRRIADGRLRDYLEGQARHEQWLTATLRLLDDTDYLRARAPLYRDAEITAASEDTLWRPEIRRFAERVTERYRHRFGAYPLVLLPCSARKPYSQSKSHGRFRDAIRYRGHVASMTSPIGVVPRELELTYPAQHYDSVVTGQWSETEVAFVADLLERFLDGGEYPEVIAHLPDEYRPITKRVAETIDVEVTETVEDHPTDTDSLGNLDDALDGYEPFPKQDRERNTLRAVADHQLGAGTGADLLDELSVEGRYPQLRAHDAEGAQLAALTREYGTLAFTLAGARRWQDSDVPSKTVHIEPFVPHGSVLAPGVVDADADILVGDDVVVDGPAAFAVGTALMTGTEMAESTRGVAVQVRHVEKL
jgi:archaeosine synthase